MLRHADSPYDAPSPPRRLPPCAGAARLGVGGARDAPGPRAPAPRRPLARRDEHGEPVPARRHPLAGPRPARAPRPNGERLDTVAAGSRGRGRHTRPVEPRGTRDARMAPRRAGMGRSREGSRGAGDRPSHARRARLTVRSPVSKVPLRTVAAAGVAADRAAERLAGGRVDRPRETRVRRHAPHGVRPPHGRHERLHARPGAGGRAGDRDLPRARETAGTTSATTRSSTGSAPSTRAGRAASTGTWSARTRRGSTRARSGSP